MTLKPYAFLLALTLTSIGAGLAHVAPAEATSMRIHAGITHALSEHVHVIPAEGRSGVPNVGIVVGSRAALVIESGLGTASGRVILDEARRIAGDRPLYVIATHFHPEHISGEQAFNGATILRPAAQQREIEQAGAPLIEMFRKMSPDNGTLLQGFSFRAADIVFDGTMTLDLGGVFVDIIPAGPAHTDGDIALFVRNDGVLFTGDVVQQNYAPFLMGEHSSSASWLAALDKLEKLPARILVPSHSAITDRRAFGDMRTMLTFLRDRWQDITTSGHKGQEAQDLLVADFKRRYPDCKNCGFVSVSIPRL
jgi:glyoxylase-like metal-dependent hydrolase (beta-lactamase superfamily II)